MKLKNIHNRKEFVKMYEFIGGTSGGVGDKDGFANNASLKDTLLGKLVNGIFRGIGWLWRKSKENFIINKLIAKLINELLRGVILYCFANGINLETGEQSGEQTEGEDFEEDDAEEDKPNVEPVVEVPEETNFDVIRKDTTVEPHLLEFDPAKPDEIIRKKVSYGFPVAIPDVNQIVVKPTDPVYYENMTKEMFDFLSKHVKSFEKMSDDQKKQIKTIYVNYLIVKRISEGLKQPVTESILNEETLVNTASKNAATSNMVRPKLDNPEAGRVSGGKKLALIGGVSANVGDILNKRDKDKNKEHEEEFGLDINKINLAEIEKIIEKNGEQSKVSDRVNPENLKTIQITAAQLINSGPAEKEGGTEKSKLQLRWNKELTKVYASFASIMNIKAVDIRGEYRSDLDAKVEGRIKPGVDKMNHQMNTERFSESLKDGNVLVDNNVTFSELKGNFAYFSFTCKNTFFISSMSSINQFTVDNPGAYLLKIENTFSSIDFGTQKFESNFDEFKNQFSQNNRDVYFLFKNPAIKKVANTTMLLLNSDSTENKLYVCRFKDGGGIHESTLITSNLEDEKIHKWTNPIKVDSMKLFKNGFEKIIKDAINIFNFKNDYSRALVPGFYNKPDIKKALIDVKDRMISKKV